MTYLNMQKPDHDVRVPFISLWNLEQAFNFRNKLDNIVQANEAKIHFPHQQNNRRFRNQTINLTKHF